MDGLIAYALAKKAIGTSMGDIGTNLTYKGTVTSVESLPTNAAAGDMYGVGTLGLYAYNGTDWGAIGRAGPVANIDDLDEKVDID